MTFGFFCGFKGLVLFIGVFQCCPNSRPHDVSPGCELKAGGSLPRLFALGPNSSEGRPTVVGISRGSFFQEGKRAFFKSPDRAQTTRNSKRSTSLKVPLTTRESVLAPSSHVIREYRVFYDQGSVNQSWFRRRGWSTKRRITRPDESPAASGKISLFFLAEAFHVSPAKLDERLSVPDPSIIL